MPAEPAHSPVCRRLILVFLGTLGVTLEFVRAEENARPPASSVAVSKFKWDRRTTPVKDLFGDDKWIYDADGDGWDDLWCHIHSSIKHRDKKRDTDGDKVSDHDEMLLWRDALVPGPYPVKFSAEEIAKANREAEIKRIAVAEKMEREWPAYLASLGKSLRPTFPADAPDPDSERVDNEAWRSKLKEEIAKTKAQEPAVQAELQRISKKYGMALRGKDHEGRDWVLAGEAAGQPITVSNQNAQSANAINADDLWPGLTPTTPFFSWQDLGQSRGLTGSGISTAIFDASGSALTTHQEFGGRVTNWGSLPPSDHPTAVANVIAGGGVLDVIQNGVNYGKMLKGVAYQSSVRSYPIQSSFTANLLAEISNGTRFSNHSYAYEHGWARVRLSNVWHWLWPYPDFTEDPRLGLYGTDIPQGWGSPQLDYIVRQGKVHLPVIGAGNATGGGPGVPVSYQIFKNFVYVPQPASVVRDWLIGDEGGYDTLTIPATAKNVLTVGSIKDVVNQQVVLSDFSGTGPTDDGRIKPDLVAVGERNSLLGKGGSLFLARTGSNTAYYNGISADTGGVIDARGTSYATPQVTGALMLAQQRRQQLFPLAAPALASTWRALAIGTAQDIGAPGPDFKCGWGIFDATALVKQLEDDASHGRGSVVKEFLVAKYEPKSYYLTLPANTPGRATLAWTDLSDGRGPDIGTYLDGGRELINDVDLIIEEMGAGTVHYPWFLHPYTTTQAGRAAPAVNTVVNGVVPRDTVNNVERIDITPVSYERRFKVTVSTPQKLYSEDTFAGSFWGGSQNVSLVTMNFIPEAPKTKDFKANGIGYLTLYFVLTLETDPGSYYQVESSSELEAGSWNVQSTFKAEEASSMVFVSGNTQESKKFWRVRRSH